MSRRERSLLDEIEDFALADPPKVTAALRRCIALGGRAGSSELRAWAAQELNGYNSPDDVPKYRIVAAPIMIDGQAGYNLISGQNIDYSMLPDVVREHVPEDIHLAMGIAEIEAMTQSGDGTHIQLGLPQAPVVAQMMTTEVGPFQGVHRVYWSVAKSRLAGVLDSVATQLVELVAEIRAGLPADEDLPSGELATQAFNVAVHGEGHRVAIQAPSTGTGTVAAEVDQKAPIEPGWAGWSWPRRIGATIIGIATIAGAIFAGIQVLP